MRHMNRMIVATVVLLVTSVSQAKFSDKVIATGPKAHAIWDSMASSARPWLMTPEFHTTIKIYNITLKNSSSIGQGEKGIICDHYVDAKVIAEAGTDYFCHLVDLTK